MTNIHEKAQVISCLLLEITVASLRVRKQANDIMISYIFSILDPVVITSIQLSNTLANHQSNVWDSRPMPLAV